VVGLLGPERRREDHHLLYIVGLTGRTPNGFLNVNTAIGSMPAKAVKST